MEELVTAVRAQSENQFHDSNTAEERFSAARDFYGAGGGDPGCLLSAGMVVQLPDHQAAGFRELRGRGEFRGGERQHDVRPSLNLEDLVSLRENYSGKLIVKGILAAADAVDDPTRGADAPVVSKLRRWKLDREPDPLKVLPEIRAAVGPETPLILDSGIMSGGDVGAVLAAGADFTLIGWAYL